MWSRSVCKRQVQDGMLPPSGQSMQIHPCLTGGSGNYVRVCVFLLIGKGKWKINSLLSRIKKKKNNLK